MKAATEKPEREPPTQDALLNLWGFMCGYADSPNRNRRNLTDAYRLVEYWPRKSTRNNAQGANPKC